MNKEALQRIASQLESTIQSSKPNVRYNRLIHQVGALHGIINDLKDDSSTIQLLEKELQEAQDKIKSFEQKSKKKTTKSKKSK
jgi:prefoldin subunit 5